jgi:hypothetical protein
MYIEDPMIQIFNCEYFYGEWWQVIRHFEGFRAGAAAKPVRAQVVPQQQVCGVQLEGARLTLVLHEPVMHQSLAP